MKKKIITLYIHGLDSKPNKDKIEIIENYSTSYALHLNYHNQPDSFNVLSDLILNKGVNCIVGSSFGGMLGYWLAEKHKIPALLYNPALNIDNSIIHFEINHNKSPYKLIILGEKDKIVSPFYTNEFLKENLMETNYEIIKYPKLEHQIDINTFKDSSEYFYNKIL